MKKLQMTNYILGLLKYFTMISMLIYWVGLRHKRSNAFAAQYLSTALIFRLHTQQVGVQPPHISGCFSGGTRRHLLLLDIRDGVVTLGLLWNPDTDQLEVQSTITHTCTSCFPAVNKMQGALHCCMEFWSPWPTKPTYYLFQTLSTTLVSR
jgi:hypothetical protein